MNTRSGRRRPFVAAALLLVLSPSALAQFAPGDVFREYPWRPRDKWQRVTGPDATHPGAKQFLPNPVNRVTIGDLARATRVEVQLERLQSHAGTNRPRMRINGKAWIAVPEARGVPGSRGSGGSTNMYLTMTYPVVRIPLDQVKEGQNTFEFTCQGAGGRAIGKIWPQWLVYGAIFRVYYDAKKRHPSGSITSPAPSSTLGDDPTFEVRATGPTGIRRVDVVGDYDDYAWRGEEVAGLWQYHFHYGAIQKHIGSATRAPYRVRWDTTWVPTQPRPFRVVARIVGTSGLVFVTPAVGGLRLARRKTVIRYRNTKIPQQWQTQKYSPRKSCETNVTGDLGKAGAARLFLTTWNGYQAMQIGMNGKSLTRTIGKNHDLDYNVLDVAPAEVRQGRNTFFTYSTTEGHGIEVQWPGIELFVRYDLPEFRASFAAFGTGCRGTGGVPLLGPSGPPILGRDYRVHGLYLRPWTPVTLVTGSSAERWGRVRLPLDLGPLGAAGCRLYVSPDVLRATISNGLGLVTFRVHVPNDPRLAGSRYYHQSIWVDPAANGLAHVFSAALAGVVSNR